MAISAGANILAADHIKPATVNAPDVATTDGTTTSATFVNTLTTTGIRGIAFTAPASGSVIVFASCGQARSSTAGGVALTDFEIRTGTTVGSGTVVRSSNEATAGVAESNSASQNRNTFSMGLVTGLTPGSSYNACLTYRVTAPTGTYNRRNIIVIPAT